MMSTDSVSNHCQNSFLALWGDQAEDPKAIFVIFAAHPGMSDGSSF
jgi:hypothetical protein